MEAIKVIINSSELKNGIEDDFGIWDEKEREFKLSIRWNEKTQFYESYKLYFDNNEEEILFKSSDLTEIVIETFKIANHYASNFLL